MKLLVLVTGVVFLAVIALLEIWKLRVPARSKMAKKIEITLVILAFVGGVVGLIRQAASPSIEERIKEAVATVFEKGTVPLEELKVSYEEIGKLKEGLKNAMRRVAESERQGVKEAEGVIEELRKSGDVSRLLDVLEKDRDVHKDELIERNREIAAVAYLKGDIEKATEAVEEILKLKPDDMDALNQKGHIHTLKGELKEAKDCYQRVIEVGIEVNNEQAQAAGIGNLGVIYRRRGDLDKAEEMHRKSLEIDKKLGQLEGMASQYGNLGLIYEMRGDLDKAE
jgi:tetratricopeptide (TPR) repeat protein